jgi:hypothetical protein
MNNTYVKILFYTILLGICCLSVISSSVVIGEKEAREIEAYLSRGDASTVYEYPGWDARGYEPLIVAHSITWDTPATLVLVSKEDITIKPTAHIFSQGAGSLMLKAGMENEHNKDYDKEPLGAVIFEDLSQPHIHMRGGTVRFYYNPTKGTEEHRFWNGSSDIYDAQVMGVKGKRVDIYTLINHVRDLQDVHMALYRDYALSQDIDASETLWWDYGKGFRPLLVRRKEDMIQPFSGLFDGNGYTIYNLFINRPDEDDVGLFGYIMGDVENLAIKNATIVGSHHVGTLAGWADNALIKNISIESSRVKAKDSAGGLIGAGTRIWSHTASISDVTVQTQQGETSLIFGQEVDSIISDLLVGVGNNQNYEEPV